VNAHILATRPSGPGPNILPATPAHSQRIDSAIEERMAAQIRPQRKRSRRCLVKRNGIFWKTPPPTK